MLSKLQLPFIAVAISACLFIWAGAYHAASATGGVSGTFASFSTQTSGSLDYFTSGGSGTLASSDIPVTFQFLNASNTSGYGTNTINAFLTVSSSTNGNAGSGGTPTIDSQPLGTTTFTFTTTGGQLLLKVTSSSANIYGLQGQSNATLADSSGAGNIVTYSSPYLNFGTGGQNSYGVTLSGLSSQLGVSGGLLNGFHAGGSGTFSASPVPEAGTLASFALLIGCGTFFLVRRRKHAAARQS